MEITITDLTMEQLKQFNPKLYEAVKSEADPEKEIADLKSQLEEKDKETGNHKEKRQKLHEKLEKANQRVEDLKAKVDEFEAKEAEIQKRELRDTKLTEAKLPDHLVTDFFKESLMNLSEADMDKAIAERKEIAEKKKGEVTNMGDEFDADGKKKELKESDKDDIKGAFGVPKKKE